MYMHMWGHGSVCDAAAQLQWLHWQGRRCAHGEKFSMGWLLCGMARVAERSFYWGGTQRCAHDCELSAA